MANKIYVAPETVVSWKNTGGTEILTLTSLGASGGCRIGEEHDFGSASHARKYGIRLRTKFATEPVLREIIEVFIARGDGTYRDGDIGGSDAALTIDSTDDRTLAMLPVMMNLVYHQDSTEEFIYYGEFECGFRYLSPVVVNQTADALSATAADHELMIWPLPDEVQ
jgi:hypothetical protein